MAFRRDAYALKGRSKIAPHALNQRSPAEGKAKSVWELKKAKKKESVEICEICGTRTNSRKRRRFLPSKPQKSKTFPEISCRYENKVVTLRCSSFKRQIRNYGRD